MSPTSGASTERSWYHRWGWVILIYMALALFWLHPVAPDPFNTVIGDTRSDVWNHVWTHWHTRYWIARGVISPAVTPWINAPHGGSLFDQNILNGILGLPFWWDSRLLFTTNATLFIQLVFAALMAYYLAIELTGSRAAGFIAGLAYAFSPYYLGYPLSSGVHERATAGTMPLYFLTLIRLLRYGGWRRALACGLAAGLTGIGCVYYLIFIFIATIAMLSALSLWEAVQGNWARLKRGFLRALLVIPFALVSLIPLQLLLNRQFSDDSLTYRKQTLYWGGFDDYRDVLGFDNYFRPQTETRPPQDLKDALYKIAYLPWTLTALALLGAAFAKRRTPAVIAILVAVFFLFLSFGPGRHGPWQQWASLPSKLLLYIVPYYNTVQGMWQQVIITVLGFAISAACFIARLPNLRTRVATTATAALLLLGETIFLSGAPFPLPASIPKLPSIYDEVIAGPPDAIVLDIPLLRGRSTLVPGEYLYYATQHERPIVQSIDAFDHPCRALFRMSSPSRQCPQPAMADADAFFAALEENDITWVALHARWLAPDLRFWVITLMDMRLGEPVAVTDDDGVMLFRRQ